MMSLLSKLIAVCSLLAGYFLFYLCERYCDDEFEDFFLDDEFEDNEQYYPHLEMRLSVPAAVPVRRLENNDQIVFDTYTKENSKEDGGGCVICLEEYIHGETLAAITACNHRFHAACIKEWLGRNDNCPLCRTTAV
ncbi:hypothetical protein ACS0TY_001112 [Phlomoides rotata]